MNTLTIILGMFALVIFAIYSAAKQRRADEEAWEAESCEAEAEAEAEQRYAAELELSEWTRDIDAFERGESPQHPGPCPRNYYSQF